MLFSLQEFLHTPSSALWDDTLSLFLRLIPPVIHIWLFDTFHCLQQSFKSFFKCDNCIYILDTGSYHFKDQEKENLAFHFEVIRKNLHHSETLLDTYVWQLSYNLFKGVVDCIHIYGLKWHLNCPYRTIWCQISLPTL